MMYSVKQVAEMLQVGDDHVKRLVDAGELDAVDVSLSRNKTKRLRIPEDALRQFLERRRVHVPVPRTRRRSQPKPRPIIDYFAVPDPQEKGRRRLKISEVAEYLSITEDHVRQLIAYGHLSAVNIGGTSQQNRYRVPEKDLFDFIERSRNEPKHRRAARLRGPDFLENLKTPEGLPETQHPRS